MITRLEAAAASQRLRAGASRGARPRPARSASAKAGVERARQRHRLRARAPPRRSRRRSARRGAPGRSRSTQGVLEQARRRCRHGQAGRRAIAAGDPASPAASCGRGCGGRRRRARTARATAATVPHSRSPRRPALLPGAGEHGADEVLARERDVERQAERAQLAEPPQDLQVLLGAEVEVEAGVDRDLLLGDAQGAGQLDSPLEPGLQVVDDVAVVGRRRGRPAAAPRCASARSRSRVSATSSNISSEPPEMSLTATAPAASARRATSTEKVSAEIGTPARRQPLDRRHQRRRLVLGRHRRPALRRHGADVEHVEARLDQRQPVGDRLLRGAAARPLEHRVDGDVDDPGGRAAGARSRVRSASRQGIAATVATAPCHCAASTPTSTAPCSAGAARCSATPRAASRWPRRAGLEACHRAGVEVVIMSGRREPQVHEAARLMGQTSYIYEAGCAFAIDGETTLLTGEMAPDEDGTDLRADRGARHPEAALRALRGPARVPRALAPRPRPLPPLPRQGRRRRGQPAARRARRTTTCGCSTTARSAARCRRSRAHPRLPPGPEAGQQGGRGRRPRPRPRLRPAPSCIAVGDSVEDLEVAAAVGRFFVVANGPERDPGLRAALAALGQRHGHRGQRWATASTRRSSRR